MKPTTDDLDLENELVQLLAKEAVRLGLGTPLHDPIVEAVEESAEAEIEQTDESVEVSDREQVDDDGQVDDTAADDDLDESETTGLATAIRGLLVFVVLFVVLYVVLKRLTGGEE
jgi:hypothetical protein